MNEITQGRRLPDGFHYFDAEPGDYWRQSYGTAEEPGAYSQHGVDFDWAIRDPAGVLGTIAKHEVTEHEDGTITVSPSILNGQPGGWHGYLERGVWRSV